MNYELINAHTFSCNVEIINLLSYDSPAKKAEVSTYSLVCQYVKDLVPSTIYGIFDLRIDTYAEAKWRISGSNR